MLSDISTNDTLDVTSASEMKVIEIALPVMGTEPKRRRRRRRRRNRNSNASSASSLDKSNISTASDDSTCATASLSSDDSSTASPQKNYQSKQRKGIHQRKSKKFPNSKKEGQNVSLEQQSKYLALDCEMVGVGPDGKKSSVARVTIVDWDGRIVWDEFVRQEQEVTDYRTFVSGVTSLDLEDATLSLEECRNHIQSMIEGKILVGHALKNDLRALGMVVHFSQVRDTAKYEPFMKTRFNDNILWPRSLKSLASDYLGREIQREGEAHSAYEDAAAAMDLYRLVRTKWEKVMDYKIKKTNEMQNKI